MTDDVDARLGIVIPAPDGRQLLEFVRSWPDPVDDVWSAVTDPERSVRWIGRYEGERAPGGTGTFTMTHEQEPSPQPMRIVACDPPRRLVVEVGDWLLEGGLSQWGWGPGCWGWAGPRRGSGPCCVPAGGSPRRPTSPTTRWAGTGPWTSCPP